MAKRKRKPMSIFIAVGLAIIMIVAVMALSACNNGGGGVGNPINCICENECYGECNFTLSVEVESLVLEATYIEGCGRPGWATEHGRYLTSSPPTVMATLTNVSGKRVAIARRDFTRTAVLFNMNIPTGELWRSGNEPAPPFGGWSWVSENLEHEESINRKPIVWQEDFPVGEHEATITVSFYINHRSNNRQLINLKYIFVFTVI